MRPLVGTTEEARQAESSGATRARQAALDLGLPDPGPKRYGFVPVEPQASLGKLSRADIENYNELGYTPPQPLFSATEARRNRAYFDEMMVAVESDGRSPYSINSWHGCCRGIWDLCTHPRLLDAVEDLLGPDFVMWGSHFFTKMPFGKLTSADFVAAEHGVAAGMDGDVPPHQDALYWPFQTSRTTTAWLAIDDADESNGAMEFGALFFLSSSADQQVKWLVPVACARLRTDADSLPAVPGSHRHALSWSTTQRTDQQLQLETDPDDLARELEERGLPADSHVNAMASGEFSLHADLLVHSSGPNRRCGLTMRFCASDCRPHGPGPGFGGQVIRSRGNPGVWGPWSVERPDDEDWSAGGMFAHKHK